MLGGLWVRKRVITSVRGVLREKFTFWLAKASSNLFLARAPGSIRSIVCSFLRSFVRPEADHNHVHRSSNVHLFVRRKPNQNFSKIFQKKIFDKTFRKRIFFEFLLKKNFQKKIFQEKFQKNLIKIPKFLFSKNMIFSKVFKEIF